MPHRVGALGEAASNPARHNRGASTEWTIETLKIRFDTITGLQERYRDQLDRVREEYRIEITRMEERVDYANDRRLTELAHERERAIRIKDDAEMAALQLAREIQHYKDEKANQYREQINAERGIYSSKADVVALGEKVDAQMRPLLEYVAANTGRSQGSNALWGYIVGGAGFLFGLISVVITLMRLGP